MYEAFFGLREKPFKLVPDPSYLFLARGHEEALAHLKHALSQGEGFVEITGEVGTGKTTLCRAFLEELDDRTEAAYIFNPRLDAVQLLAAINDELGIPSRDDNIKVLVDALNAFLMEKKAEGKAVLLIIDEAQNLSREVLEQLRLLSNLETTKTKLIQIVLVGQPELGEMLDSYELRQLSQRIALRCRLSPLTSEETRKYIRHRLAFASQGPEISFSSGALRAVYMHARGVPRLINVVCERALLTAFARNERKISRKTVRRAVKELDSRGKWGLQRMTRVIRVPSMIAALCIIFFAALAYLPETTVTKKESKVEGEQSGLLPVAFTSIQDADTIPLPDPERWFRQVSTAESRRIAFGYVAGAWKDQFEGSAYLAALEDDRTYFRLCARQTGLTCNLIEADLSLLKRLNLPAIFELHLPEDRSPRYLALRRLDGAKAVLYLDPDYKDLVMDEDTLNAYWSGRAYLFWRDFLSLGGSIGKHSKGESVTSLKVLMREIGFEGVPLTPCYDEKTRQAVKALQERYGLDPDGIVGPLTKVVLYNQKEALDIPHIN